MKAFVLTDKSLERHAGRFVWLAIDIDKAANAAFLTKYPVKAVPTLLVIDPASEKVTLRSYGAATVPQMQRFLDEGARSVKGRARGVDELLAHADRLYGAGKDEQAIVAYRSAFRDAPPKWPRYPRAFESYLYSLQSTKNHETCAKEARDRFSRVQDSPSAANVVATGLDCALSLPESVADRASLVDDLRARALEVIRRARLDRISSRKPFIAGDDISGVFDVLVRERDEAKDREGMRAMAAQWVEFLEGEAAKAISAEERTVYDSHRLGAYLKLGKPELAIPMLEASERDLPSDYNPPARLAAAFKAMAKYDEALAASDRALAKVYGPRRLSVLRTRADIYVAKGDQERARQTIREAIAAAEALPAGQRSEAAIAGLRKRLEAMTVN